MRTDWIKSSQKWFNYPLIQHKVTKELCLVGKYGEIWVKNSFIEPKWYGVSTSSRALKIDPKNPQKQGGLRQNKRGSESLFFFYSDEFEKVAKSLKCFKNRIAQIRRANAF